MIKWNKNIFKHISSFQLKPESSASLNWRSFVPSSVSQASVGQSHYWVQVRPRWGGSNVQHWGNYPLQHSQVLPTFTQNLLHTISRQTKELFWELKGSTVKKEINFKTIVNFYIKYGHFCQIIDMIDILWFHKNRDSLSYQQWFPFQSCLHIFLRIILHYVKQPKAVNFLPHHCYKCIVKYEIWT